MIKDSLLQGFVFEKAISTFPQRKRYRVTNQEVKLLMAVSMLSTREMSVRTKKVFFFIRELNHTANYWYTKGTLNKLVEMRLLLATSVGDKGFFKYRMSMMGTLLLHDLDDHAKMLAKSYLEA